MRKILLIVGVLVVAGGVGAYLWWGRGTKSSFQFRTTRIERGWVQQTVSAAGSLSAVATVQVGTQVSGTIREIYVDYNSPVKAGEKLALIDPASFRAEVEQARAAWEAAKATVASAESDLKVAASVVEQAEADLDLVRANEHKAELNAAYAERVFRRYEELRKSDAISEQDLDTQRHASEQAAAELEAARAQVLTVRAALSSARSRLAAAQAQIEVALARRDQAKAALDFAQVNLDRTLIVSPIDGVVVDRAVNVGQTVAASFNTPTLFTIAQDLGRMQIEADVDEADIGGLTPGSRALFTVDAFPGRDFRGTVTQVRLSPKIVQNVVTYTVIVSAQNPNGELLPGMTANVVFLVDERQGVLRVPNAALRFQPSDEMVASANANRQMAAGERDSARPREFGGEEGPVEGDKVAPSGTVWVLDRGAMLLRPVQVRLGLTDARFTELTSNELAEGDEVVTAVISDNKGAARMPFAVRMGPR